MTGSGKTAAFALPLLERLLFRSRRVRATYVLVLTPTRELAVQARIARLLTPAVTRFWGAEGGLCCDKTAVAALPPLGRLLLRSRRMRASRARAGCAGVPPRCACVFLRVLSGFGWCELVCMRSLHCFQVFYDHAGAQNYR